MLWICALAMAGDLAYLDTVAGPAADAIEAVNRAIPGKVPTGDILAELARERAEEAALPGLDGDVGLRDAAVALIDELSREIREDVPVMRRVMATDDVRTEDLDALDAAYGRIQTNFNVALARYATEAQRLAAARHLAIPDIPVVTWAGGDDWTPPPGVPRSAHLPGDTEGLLGIVYCNALFRDKAAVAAAIQEAEAGAALHLDSAPATAHQRILAIQEVTRSRGGWRGDPTLFAATLALERAALDAVDGPLTRALQMQAAGPKSPADLDAVNAEITKYNDALGLAGGAFASAYREFTAHWGLNDYMESYRARHPRSSPAATTAAPPTAPPGTSSAAGPTP